MKTAIASSKKCFKCGFIKPAAEFYAHPKMADGLLGKCKECTKRDSAKRRMDNLESVREYDRVRAKNPERSAAAAEISKRWRNEDQRRSACHSAVARALRNGTIERSPCVICGSQKTVAHHESYDHPLDVVWYCQAHHKQRHKEMAIAGLEP